jgi:hypothetical protein
MNYPDGMSDGVAFDTLSPEGIDQQHLPANSSMNATVTGFFPRVTYDRADVNASITSAPASEGPQVFYNISSVSSRGCQLRSRSNFTIQSLPPPPINAMFTQMILAHALDPSIQTIVMELPV